ncbi:thiamine-phosphate pyrophosphorylase [Xenorhabdus japonica]|uniref:Thiamine-phosphate pyrophosphorylase n=1 Tax=Xenorhabdus japonica TaxID=53341 RepID=A0A1I5CX90_9GAMM|nr:thiamine-phosphate pyrophosphorylase [Xenorhabdus japonica]
MKLDPFYPIVDSATWVELVVPLGIKQIQLRIKDEDIKHIRNEIRKSKIICSRFNCT